MRECCRVELMDRNIDNSFNWLIMLMSTINGFLLGLVGTIDEKKAVASALIPPFFVLIIIWFLGYMVRNRHLRAVLKTCAWFFASFMFELLTVIFSDVLFGALQFLHVNVFVLFPPMALLWVAFLILLPFKFFDTLIRPIYEEVYEDSIFLKSSRRLVRLYVISLGAYIALILPSIFSGAFTLLLIGA